MRELFEMFFLGALVVLIIATLFIIGVMLFYSFAPTLWIAGFVVLSLLVGSATKYFLQAYSNDP